MIAHVLDFLRIDDKQDPHSTEVNFVESHNPRYDEMKKRYGNWWAFSNRLSMFLPFSALDEAIEKKLLVCPICEGVFSKNSALLCHLSKGIIDAVRLNTPLDIKRLSAGSHSFVDARIYRNNGESLANALGLSNIDDIGVIEHLKGFPVSNLENLNEIMQHGDWKAVWNRFLRKGLGEFKLKERLQEKRGFYAYRYGYEDVEIEWNYYLRPRTKVNVHEADVMVFHKNTEGKMVLLFPWEAKMHSSIRSAVWMHSMANIVYSVILTCGFISGYGLMVTKHLNTKTFTAYLSNYGKGRIIEMADGGIVNINLNGTSEESRYDLSVKVRDPDGTEIFSRIIDFWIEQYDSSNHEVVNYINLLLKTIENKIQFDSISLSPSLQSTQTRRLTRCAPKKNYGRYDEIMTIVEKITRSGHAISKSLLTKVSRLTEKELDATLDGLQRNGHIIRIKQLSDLPTVNLAKAKTIVSNYVPNTRMAVKGQAHWYAATKIDGNMVNFNEIIKYETDYRKRIRNTLNTSEFVGSSAKTITADIRRRVGPGYGTGKVSKAIARWVEFFLDDLFVVTNIRLELGQC